MSHRLYRMIVPALIIAAVVNALHAGAGNDDFRRESLQVSKIESIKDGREDFNRVWSAVREQYEFKDGGFEKKPESPDLWMQYGEVIRVLGKKRVCVYQASESSSGHVASSRMASVGLGGNVVAFPKQKTDGHLNPMAERVGKHVVIDFENEHKLSEGDRVRVVVRSSGARDIEFMGTNRVLEHLVEDRLDKPSDSFKDSKEAQQAFMKKLNAGGQFEVDVFKPIKCNRCNGRGYVLVPNKTKLDGDRSDCEACSKTGKSLEKVRVIVTK